jgi:hypothetical protein
MGAICAARLGRILEAPDPAELLGIYPEAAKIAGRGLAAVRNSGGGGNGVAEDGEQFT